MAKIGALPAKDIVDGLRGVIDFYCHPVGFVARKWPRSPGRNRNPAVVAAQQPFIYINKLASTLPADVIEPYQQLAVGSGLTWKDYLNRFYINASIRVTIIPHAGDYKISGIDMYNIVWKDSDDRALDDLNRVATTGWTALSLQPYTSTSAILALIVVTMKADSVGAGNYSRIILRKHGTTPNYITLLLDKAGTTAGNFHGNQYLIGLSNVQAIEYNIVVGAGWQLDTSIDVHGYVEEV